MEYNQVNLKSVLYLGLQTGTRRSTGCTARCPLRRRTTRSSCPSCCSTSPLCPWPSSGSGPCRLPSCPPLTPLLCQPPPCSHTTSTRLSDRRVAGAGSVTKIYYPLEVSSTKYYCLGVFRKEYFRLYIVLIEKKTIGIVG